MSVYFATCREVNAVKIGSSFDPWGRLPEIQTGCPLPITIEAILPGGMEEEFQYHNRFEDAHLRGEWFTITEMIESIIEHNRAEPMPAKRTLRAGRKDKPTPPPRPSPQDRKRYALAMKEMREDRERRNRQTPGLARLVVEALKRETVG